MAIFLKKRLDQTVTDAIDAKVRSTVEGIMDSVKKRGDAAVRELSAQFDKWSPRNFELSPQEIQHAIDACDEQLVRDTEYCQTNVRRFAEAQMRTLVPMETRVRPAEQSQVTHEGSDAPCHPCSLPNRWRSKADPKLCRWIIRSFSAPGP